MAEVTNPQLLQMLNSGGQSAKTPQPRGSVAPAGVAPTAAPSPTRGISDNPILQAKQLGILLDQGAVAKSHLDLEKLGLEIKRLQNELSKNALTEQQSKELARYISEREGQNYYKLAETKGNVPNSLLNKFSTVTEGITGSQNLGDWVRSLDTSNAAQIARTGQDLFVEGIKREMTGAAGNMKEPGELRGQYFPGAFQRTDPDYWLSLEKTRQAQIDAAYRNSGLPALDKPAPTKQTPKFTEADIQHTMKIRNMTRDQVLQRLGLK